MALLVAQPPNVRWKCMLCEKALEQRVRPYSKVNATWNLVTYCLLAATASSRWVADITKVRYTSFVMLFQHCTEVSFSSYLIWRIFPFVLLFRRWNACSDGVRSGDWLGQSKTFFSFDQVLCCEASVFWDSLWDWNGASVQPLFFTTQTQFVVKEQFFPK